MPLLLHLPQQGKVRAGNRKIDIQGIHLHHGGKQACLGRCAHQRSHGAGLLAHNARYRRVDPRIAELYLGIMQICPGNLQVRLGSPEGHFRLIAAPFR